MEFREHFRLQNEIARFDPLAARQMHRYSTRGVGESVKLLAKNLRRCDSYSMHKKLKLFIGFSIINKQMRNLSKNSIFPTKLSGKMEVFAVLGQDRNATCLGNKQQHNTRNLSKNQDGNIENLISLKTG